MKMEIRVSEIKIYNLTLLREIWSKKQYFDVEIVRSHAECLDFVFLHVSFNLHFYSFGFRCFSFLFSGAFRSLVSFGAQHYETLQETYIRNITYVKLNHILKF